VQVGVGVAGLFGFNRSTVYATSCACADVCAMQTPNNLRRKGRHFCSTCARLAKKRAKKARAPSEGPV
jgi:hypothetical protein